VPSTNNHAGVTAVTSEVRFMTVVTRSVDAKTQPARKVR